MECQDFVIGSLKLTNYETLRSIVESAIKNGIRCFDTAPSYQTESILGAVINDLILEKKLKREECFISDKIDAWQMQETNGDIIKHFFDALHKMKLEYIDLLLVHWPIPEYFERTWKAFELLYNEGVVKNIGVCNIRVGHLQRMEAYQTVKPHFVQIERHPLRICANEIDYCKAKGIKVQAYSPLCRMNPLIKESVLLNSLKSKYHKKDVGQIILRWHLQTGSIPVFTTQNPKRISSNLDIYDFQLESQEIEQINQMNINYKIFLESTGCPGYENW